MIPRQRAGRLGQRFSGLGGLANCLLYVRLSVCSTDKCGLAGMRPVCQQPNYFLRVKTPEPSSTGTDVEIPRVL